VRRSRYVRACLLGLGFTALLSTAAPAQEAAERKCEVSEQEVAKRVAKLSDLLKSPFCPGKTLLNCTSYQAFEVRKEMKDWAVECLTDDEIIAKLRVRFGESVENPPQPWYTVFVPFLPFVIGAILLVFVLLTWRRRIQANQADDTAIEATPEDIERLAKLRARVAADED
jgi:cytochrome c-type biogenesis protein CcmH/NrfF